MADEESFGEVKFSLWDKIRLLQEWAPVMTYVQEFLGTEDVHAKTLIVTSACEWLASKSTGTDVDDELVAHVDAILRSSEGEAMLRWVVAKIEEASGNDE
jgi:hypothetical protein